MRTIQFSQLIEVNIYKKCLLTWTHDYGLTVNNNKTKVIVFRSSLQLGNNSFYYNGEQVEIVNTFAYLGMLLNYNGKFNVIQKTYCCTG